MWRSWAAYVVLAAHRPAVVIERVLHGMHGEWGERSDERTIVSSLSSPSRDPHVGQSSGSESRAPQRGQEDEAMSSLSSLSTRIWSNHSNLSINRRAKEDGATARLPSPRGRCCIPSPDRYCRRALFFSVYNKVPLTLNLCSHACWQHASRACDDEPVHEDT